MHRSHFADRVRAFLLAAALVSALICPQALAADAAGSGGCTHGHTLTTCRGGKSVCAVCGETVDIRAAQYTGWLTVEGTADRMYFLSGEHVTGWQQLDGGTYHFDDDGIVHDTETVDTRTCTTNGYAITTCRTCGETCRSAVLRYAGHSWDADHVCTKCGTQGKNIADAQVKTAPAVYNGKDAVCAVAVTYQGRQLTVRTDEADVDGCISYTNNTRVGLGTVSIRGMRDFYGTVSAQYEILPGGVRDTAAAEIGQKQVRLDWTAGRWCGKLPRRDERRRRQHLDRSAPDRKARLHRHGSRAGNGVHVPSGRLHAGGRQVVFLAVLLQHGHGDDAARRRVCTVRTARHDRRAGGWAHRDPA